MLQMKAVLAGNAALAQIEAVRQAWEDALKEEGEAIKAEYDKTHATWDTDVQFQMKVKVTPKEQYVDVWARNRIYWFVHESVSVMRGVLSSDWSPKTQPRVLGSGAGSGRLLYASKKVSKPPYPAREFTEKIIEVRQPGFARRVEKATRDAVKKGP